MIIWLLPTFSVPVGGLSPTSRFWDNPFSEALISILETMFGFSNLSGGCFLSSVGCDFFSFVSNKFFSLFISFFFMGGSFNSLTISFGGLFFLSGLGAFLSAKFFFFSSCFLGISFLANAWEILEREWGRFKKADR